MFNHGLKTYSHGLALAMSAILMLSAAFAVPPKKPKLSMQEAQKIALEKEPGTIKSSELEKEHGVLIYSFDIVRDNQIHEVGVDANTGKIVEDKIEDPAAEAKEEQEEQEEQAKKSAKHDQKEHK
jgi:Peptidase propeptide and YPEB domain